MSSNVHIARGALFSADAGVRVTQQALANMAKAKLDSLVSVHGAESGPIITNPQTVFPAGAITTAGHQSELQRVRPRSRSRTAR